MIDTAPLVFSAPQYMQTKDKKPAYYFTVTVKEPLVFSSENKPTISDVITTPTGQDFVKTFADIFAVIIIVFKRVRFLIYIFNFYLSFNI